MEIKSQTFKVINRCLLIAILGINLYLLGAPLWPQIQFWLAKHHTSAVNNLPYKTAAKDESGKNNSRAELPADNRLVIPSLVLNQPILSGSDPKTVNKGIWARPNTSTPPKASNTVLVGHRFSYRGAPSLYHLDKVKIGDTVYVYWQKTEYIYRITQTKVVAATATEIEDASPTSRLTIYTCTPLWNVKDRLVVVADLISGGRNE